MRVHTGEAPSEHEPDSHQSPMPDKLVERRARLSLVVLFLASKLWAHIRELGVLVGKRATKVGASGVVVLLTAVS